MDLEKKGHEEQIGTQQPQTRLLEDDMWSIELSMGHVPWQEHLLIASAREGLQEQMDLQSDQNVLKYFSSYPLCRLHSINPDLCC